MLMVVHLYVFRGWPIATLTTDGDEIIAVHISFHLVFLNGDAAHEEVVDVEAGHGVAHADDHTGQHEPIRRGELGSCDFIDHQHGHDELLFDGVGMTGDDVVEG